MASQQNLKEYVSGKIDSLQGIINARELLGYLNADMEISKVDRNKILDLSWKSGNAPAVVLLFEVLIKFNYENDPLNEQWFQTLINALDASNHYPAKLYLKSPFESGVNDKTIMAKSPFHIHHKIWEQINDVFLLSERDLDLEQIVIELISLQANNNVTVIDQELQEEMFSTGHTLSAKKQRLLNKMCEKETNWMVFLLLAIKKARQEHFLTDIFGGDLLVRADSIEEMINALNMFVRVQNNEVTAEEQKTYKEQQLKNDYQIDCLKSELDNARMHSSCSSNSNAMDFELNVNQRPEETVNTGNETNNLGSTSLKEIDNSSICTTTTTIKNNLESNYVKNSLAAKKPRIENDIDESVTTDNNIHIYNDVDDDYDDDEDDQTISNNMEQDEPIIPKVLKLRTYQEELAEKAVSGKNSLIIAPTGVGKTHVGMLIAKQHLDEDLDDNRVAFFVPTVALVNQQWKQFQTYLNEYSSVTTKLHGSMTDRPSLISLINNFKIVVMTAQILVDALKNKEMKLSESFTLMIFDECHHALKGHSYSQIMDIYHTEKEEIIDNLKRDNDTINIEIMSINMPQIVGFTASVQLENAKSLGDAKMSVLKLCSNLDSNNVSIAKRHLDDMNKVINKPTEDIIQVEKRPQDKFAKMIIDLMKCIEIKLNETKIQCEKRPELKNNFKHYGQPPIEKDSVKYRSWLSSHDRPFASIDDSHYSRICLSCKQFLYIYNEALLINLDCQSIDALKFIRRKFKKELPDHSSMNKTEKDFFELFKKDEKKIEELTKTENNPKLIKLKETLKLYCSEPKSRAITFVKTVNLANILKDWINNDDSLSSMKAEKLVGTRESGTSGGMTQNQQNETLKNFENGKYRILIATSIGEEGLDISNCDLVIVYDHVTDLRAMIQRRGRARMDNSKYVLITSKENESAMKEIVNRIKEDTMMKAVKHFNELDEKSLKKAMEKVQKEMSFKRKLKELTKNKILQNNDLYSIKCKKCKLFVCMSTDFRKIQDTNHAVISSEFKYKTKPHHRPRLLKEVNVINKVHCKRCDMDWGIEIMYTNIKFPVLKIASLILIKTTDRTIRQYKKWSECPFMVPGITSTEIESCMCSSNFDGSINDNGDEDEDSL